MNWPYIFKLATTLFIVQSVIGYLYGLFSPEYSSHHWFLSNYLTSLISSLAIFSFFAYRQKLKPFLHAWISLLVTQVAGFALLLIYVSWFGSWPSFFIVIVDLLVIVCALIIGTQLGIYFQNKPANQPDA